MNFLIDYWLIFTRVVVTMPLVTLLITAILTVTRLRIYDEESHSHIWKNDALEAVCWLWGTMYVGIICVTALILGALWGLGF